MRMRRKARVRGISSSFPDAQRAPDYAGGIAIIRERKVMLGLQPVAILACELVEWSAFDHRRFLRTWTVMLANRSMDTTMNRNYRNSLFLK
jgi:hypothetical protein